MIDHKKLNQFLKKAEKHLEGEWVIIGGTVLPILGSDHRTTVDIDIVSLKESNNQNQQSMKLMKIAEEIGLPVEAINQAGAFYLRKIKDFQDNLILITESKNLKIYRPNALLFFELKAARMSESDLLDCLEFIRVNPLEIEKYRNGIRSTLKKFLSNSKLNPDAISRLQELFEEI